jgi:hypothetical protein
VSVKLIFGSVGIAMGNEMRRIVLQAVSVVFVVAFASFLLIHGCNSINAQSVSPEQPVIVPPSLTLLGDGARWAAQRGNSTLFVDWEDNYLAHGNTDGISWGPWPPEADMKNWTDSVVYVLNESGFNVTLAGDMPDSLEGYDLLVLHAYWAVEPSQLPMVRDFLANGGGVVLLAGVPEYMRCFCRDWWTYRCPTDNGSLGMDEVFGCDGNYFNTGGYANVTVDNPFGSSLMAGDTLIEGAGESNAGIYEPYNGSQVIAEWQTGCAFAYTYQYGQGRVYYQATFVAVDPPVKLVGDVNGDGTVDISDAITLSGSFLALRGDSNWNPNADVNNDGIVDLSDAIMLSNHFLETYL